MSLRGNLKDFNFGEILQLLYQQKKTGILEITKIGKLDCHIYFQNGNICGLLLVGKGGYDILRSILHKGIIDRETYSEIIAEHKRSLKKIDFILKERGILDEDDLLKIIEIDAKKHLFKLFEANRGLYEFIPSESVKSNLPEHINSESLLMESLRLIDELKQERVDFFSSLSTFNVLKEISLNERIRSLKPYQRRSFERLLGEKKSLSYIIENSCFDELDTLRILKGLIKDGFIEEIPPSRSKKLFGRYLERFQERLKEGGIPLWKGIVFIVTYLVFLVVVFSIILAVSLEIIKKPSYVNEVEIRNTPLSDLLSPNRRDRIRVALEIYRILEGNYPENLQNLNKSTILAGEEIMFPYRHTYYYKKSENNPEILDPIE